jgi:hypothetical protein
VQTVEKFQSANDFWVGMVEPDFQESQNNQGDLRAALHAAISLFHMSDWVFEQHQSMVRKAFTFNDKSGQPQSVKDSKTFAHSLEEIESNFALIRGIANAAKHLALKDIRPHPDAPSHSANTASQSLGWGEGGYGVGPYGGGPQVMLEGANGHLHFSQIATSVYDMWVKLKNQHNW